MIKTIHLFIFFSVFTCNLAFAENYLSLYGGKQTSSHSRVSGVDSEGKAFDFPATWEAKSFDPPAYYGVRFTKWFKKNKGYSLDFTHSKVYADQETLDKNGFNILEFTDGLNILTLNYLTRYPKLYHLYWGVGAGISVPHVEIQRTTSSPKTYEYQFGGYAFGSQIGIEKNLSRKLSAFVEYKFNYIINDVDMAGGGYLKTNIVVNAVNLGLNYKF